MTRNEPKRGAGFHELPLVFFTALATAGAGVGTAHLGLLLLGWVPLVPAPWVMALVGTMLATGLLFSVGHLGRPFRSVLALSRVGKSPLSNEVLVVGTALAASLVSVLLPAGHFLAAPFTFVALVGCALILIAMGLVYRLPVHLTWGGSALGHPFILGLAFGLTVLLGTLRPGTEARGELLVMLVLLADGFLVWDRTRRIPGVLLLGIPVHPGILTHRGAAVVFRTLLGVLLPAGALLQGWWELGVVLLFINLFLDRFLFYGLAVRSDTEAEISRAEAALRAIARPTPGSSDSTPTLS